MPVPEAFNRITVELKYVADLFEKAGDTYKAEDVRAAAYFIGKVARELEKWARFVINVIENTNMEDTRRIVLWLKKRECFSMTGTNLTPIVGAWN